jgi:adenosine deaminase
LVKYIVENKIPLEVCINSNLRTGVYNEYDDHSIKELNEKGVLITINTDDPTMFETNLADEYLVLREKIKIPMSNIIRIMNNSIEASFARAEDKVLLKRELNSFWIQNIDDLN